MLDTIDHIAIATDDLEEARRFYREVMGLAEVHRETLPDQGVEAVLLRLGGSHLELLSPLDAGSGVARFLERRGPGLHHVAYRVSDIEAALATLSVAGVRLIDNQPRIGIRGSRVAFLHPSASGGVLTEIVQPAGH
ncbi:MAG: methylmalonyl-CoA epimerase [Solirubrobacteraceae bacterium]